MARTEDLTYICAARKEDAGPTNNWMSPEEGYRRAGEIFAGSMKGRTMYVIPFSMGPVGSPLSKIGIELTDSIYVVLNMRIMTHVGPRGAGSTWAADGEFTKCLHGKAERDIKRRLILHFPEDNAIWSVGSGYGGNVLLGKKCLALRIASYLGKQEGWMAEHMLILGVENPQGRVEYVAAAFPSACGKTNLAMMVPPEGPQDQGLPRLDRGRRHRLDAHRRRRPAVGHQSRDRLLRRGPRHQHEEQPEHDGRPSAATRSTPTCCWPATARCGGKGGEGPPPAEGIDWQGRPWKPGMKDEHGKPIVGAHPNSRFTAPFEQLPLRPADPARKITSGVPISAFVFGGRRAQLAPLVYESFDWEHGVFVGATMASERTAAQFGKLGEVRRDPMAMLPFCGYHMGDYFQHWLTMGRRMAQPPKIFHVNWFRTDEKGKFLWPGYGENLRVIEWILDRCRGEADALQTPIGMVPTPESLDLSGLDISRETLGQAVGRQSARIGCKRRSASRPSSAGSAIGCRAPCGGSSNGSAAKCSRRWSCCSPARKFARWRPN